MFRLSYIHMATTGMIRHCWINKLRLFQRLLFTAFKVIVQNVWQNIKTEAAVTWAIITSLYHALKFIDIVRYTIIKIVYTTITSDKDIHIWIFTALCKKNNQSESQHETSWHSACTTKHCQSCCQHDALSLLIYIMNININICSILWAQ